MASKAFNAQGTLIKRGDGANTEVFTSIGEIKSFQGPGGNAAVIDVTNMDSTAKEKVVGLADEGQLTLEINLDPTSTQHKGLVSDRAGKVKRNFEILFSDAGGTKATFAAYVLGFQISGAVDQAVSARATLEITGPVTFVWPT